MTTDKNFRDNPHPEIPAEAFVINRMFRSFSKINVAKNIHSFGFSYI